MKIECPNCRLVGEVNEQEVPLAGRYIDCPRCRTGFQVKKPANKSWNPDMMNLCPVCNYSTFSEEMFDVCPKCGLNGSEYKEKRESRQEDALANADLERLNRSLRPEEFIQPPAREEEPVLFQLPATIRYTGLGVLIISAITASYGIFGLASYYSDKESLLATINETLLEPVSSTTFFLDHGLSPWVLTLYSLLMLVLAILFLRRRSWTLKGLELGAWTGLAIGVMYEIVDYVSYIRRSSDSPSMAYYLVGLVNALFMVAVWIAVPLALVWWLRNDRLREAFDVA